MGQPLKTRQIIGLFGDKAGNKLIKFLNDCCSSDCCPSEKYTIRVEFIDCNGVASPGQHNPRYRILATSNTTLGGLLNFQVLVYSPSETPYSINFFPDGIVAGEEFTVRTNVTFPDGAEASVYVLDSRGNWSNSLTFTPVNCP